MFLDSNVIGTGILVDRLYMLEIITSHNEILHANSKGTKRKLIENFASLWHKRLEYYGRYDGSGEQHPGPFASFLKECDIIP
ncbi:hypothetical protein V2J09_013277 [Rumex salicifolius]